jgi:hypothetical protein
LAFIDSHSSSKERSMNGAQFHSLWVGEAGGRLIQSTCELSGLGLAEPFCQEGRHFLRLFIGGEVASVREQMVLTTSGRRREGFHFSGGYGGILSTGDGEYRRSDS